ncbi:helix-turn-helix domain-containing protein [Caulobacter segnis]|uniref:helix-turn-helix domain-containing protein n=1 Tax=Caulobacter segnis TaxID=88688 RepID=UPI00240F26F8|nr:helix-turn-helix domain-containing protein [Caulobacter segnis]MDG2521886.1 helix-turn-helix domain-containing protein [Caulobacter segnis]
MDSLITAAARAMAAGDVLGALKRVALREDPAALALRGIAMARLGDFTRARAHLKAAQAGFGPAQAISRARCAVALAEIDLAARDLAASAKDLDQARAVLERGGDGVNAAHAGHLQVRRLVLIGRLKEAEAILGDLNPAHLPLPYRAAHELVVAALEVRRLRARAALEAVARAEAAARQARSSVLLAEAEHAREGLLRPAANLVRHGQGRAATLEEVEALLTTDAIVVDACRRVVQGGGASVSLAARPVLMALARGLAKAWPREATRSELLITAFGARQADDSHRARLRVEIGRLRAELSGLCEIVATPGGYALAPSGGREAVLLDPPQDGPHASLMAVLSDGEAWSSSGLALVLGKGQRSVQRGLEALARVGKVQAHGAGRTLRWVAPPVPGFPTALLLMPHAGSV